MSRHFTWVFNTESEVNEYLEKYIGHPFISPGIPYKGQDGRWYVNVTEFKID